MRKQDFYDRLFANVEESLAILNQVPRNKDMAEITYDDQVRLTVLLEDSLATLEELHVKASR